VKRKDAVFNVTHTAVLIGALAKGDTAAIARALDDRLHQPYRKALIPNYDTVREAALSEGAHAFFISGSGSTCMAIYTDPEFPSRMAGHLTGLCCSWRILPLSVDFDGARAI
jgi:homoserine kinase